MDPTAKLRRFRPDPRTYPSPASYAADHDTPTLQTDRETDRQLAMAKLQRSA